MTKAELITKIQQTNKKLELSKNTVNCVSDTLFAELLKGIKKDGRFSWPGFGTWTVRKRQARKGRNPQTGEVIQIKASKTIGFKPTPTVKHSL